MQECCGCGEEFVKEFLHFICFSENNSKHNHTNKIPYKITSLFPRQPNNPNSFTSYLLQELIMAVMASDGNLCFAIIAVVSDATAADVPVVPLHTPLSD